MNKTDKGNRGLHLFLTDQKSKGGQPDILPQTRLTKHQEPAG
jgi:hypothetical protein